MNKSIPALILLASLAFITKAQSEDKSNALAFEAGAVLMSLSSEFGDNHAENWIALGLIDGTPDMGWSSKESAAFPHKFLFELSTDFELTSISLDATQVEEASYPGISPRQVLVEAATDSAQGPYTTIVSGEMDQGTEVTFGLPAPTPARWLRLSILSNWGAPDFTELMEFKANGQRTSERSPLEEIDGTYTTNWDNFFIRTRENDLVGCYDLANGVFSGAPDEWFMNIEWREDSVGDRPGFGTSVMAITEDGSHFSGFFYDSKGILDGTWTGSRINDALPRCVEPLLKNNQSRVALAMDSVGHTSLYGLYFDYNSNVLKPESDGVLGQVLAWMNDHPGKTVFFEGHTDSDGSDMHNLSLSQRRAEAVISWLTKRGISVDRMRAVGHGESQPVADNVSSKGKALNRRVEIRLGG